MPRALKTKSSIKANSRSKAFPPAVNAYLPQADPQVEKKALYMQAVGVREKGSTKCSSSIFASLLKGQLGVSRRQNDVYQLFH